VSPDACTPELASAWAQWLGEAAGDVDDLVLRWKASSAREQLDAARPLVTLSRRPRILISDRLDVALAMGADGVQLPEAGFLPRDLREHWPLARIGVSRHDRAGVTERSEGADFALVGPVYRTPSKPGVDGLGVGSLAAIVHASPVPVVALGGVDAGRVQELVQAGAAGVAVRGAVFDAADPVTRIRRLREALDSAAAASPDDQFVARADRRTRPE
jgi:thiamine-phosphate diphosphorylase